jgi:hypothetical protein
MYMKISFINKILGLALILLVGNNKFMCAQRNSKGKETKIYSDSELRKIDSILNGIPIKRQEIHERIKDQVARIDRLDGNTDGQVTNYRGHEVDLSITNNIIRRAYSLKAFIENATFEPSNENMEHNTKVKYLRQIQENLVAFADKARSGKFDITQYSSMFNELEGIIIANKEGNLKQYVSTHATMGLYQNRELFRNDTSILNALIDSMCYKYPEAMESRLREVYKFKGAGAIITHISKRSALEIMNFATSTGIEAIAVANCTDPKVMAISKMANGTQNPYKAMSFLNDFMEGKRTLQEINEITSNPEKYFKGLVNIRQQNLDQTSYVVNRDLKIASGDYVRQINELHDETAEVRFKCLNALNETELYYLATLCNDEIYTSSFLGVFKRIMGKLETRTGFDYLQNLKMDTFRTFIRMCANYNTLDPFLASMPSEKQNELMNSFVSGLGSKAQINLSGATDVADAFGSISDEKLIDFLQSRVQHEYEYNYNANNIEGVKVYFILFSLLSSKNPNSNDSVFDATMTTKLKLPPIIKMPYQNLVDTINNSITENMFFYGDEDGIGGFNGFMGRSRNSGQWIIDESNKYWVVFTAKNSKAPFKLYANKPLKEPEDEVAQKELAEYLVAQNITPTLIVHRGHSYHLQSTINAINEDHKVIILGSCGGYHNLSTILTRCPDGQITSSKQVGKGTINNRIIEEVNATIMRGEDLMWPQITSNLDKVFTSADREEWNDYVFPHKNLGALFLKAYKSLSENKL